MTTGERWGHGGDLRAIAVRLALIGAWLGAGWLAGLSAFYYVHGGGVGMDAHTYWTAGRVEHPYLGSRPGHGFLYSPLFAQAMRLPAMLPWPMFCALWLGMETSAYLWLLRPLPLRWRVPALLGCVPALAIGNIYGLLGVALVFALRRPGLLAFPALTKIAPAGIGAVWFAARGEWRKVGNVVAVTAALTLASFIFEPALWFEWLRFLTTHSGDGASRLVQIPLGLVLGAYASRSDRRWLLVVGWWLTMPMAAPLAIQSWVALAPLARLTNSFRQDGESRPGMTVARRAAVSS